MSELTQLALEMLARDQAWSQLPILLADAMTGAIVYATPRALALFGGSLEELLDEALASRLSEGRLAQATRRDGRTLPVCVERSSIEVMGKTLTLVLVMELPEGEGGVS